MDNEINLRDRLLRRVNSVFINKIGDTPFFHSLARPYIAGSSLDEGLASIQEYWNNRWYSTFDVLGESARTVEDANRFLCVYIEMIKRLGKKYGDKRVCSVSVKPTSMCASIDDSPQTLHEDTKLIDLELLVKIAEKNNVDVTLDMEDSRWTDASIEVSQEIWRRKHLNFGMVLQSRLHRTASDVQNIFSENYPIPRDKMRVRACIGIYVEPQGANNDKEVAKEMLVRRVNDLFNYGVYVEIATHDPRVVSRIIRDIIVPKRISPDRFEFQFLRGVANGYKLAPELMDKGYKVRFYMPTELREGDGMPYMRRRLIANPGLVLLGTKNFVQNVFRNGKNGN